MLALMMVCCSIRDKLLEVRSSHSLLIVAADWNVVRIKLKFGAKIAFMVSVLIIFLHRILRKVKAWLLPSVPMHLQRLRCMTRLRYLIISFLHLMMQERLLMYLSKS